MIKKGIGLIGLLMRDIDDCGGGVIKSRNYAKLLKERYGEVIISDRALGYKNKFKYLYSLFKVIIKSKVIIVMFSTIKMLKTLLPILIFFKKIFMFKIEYVVLGGWLPSCIEKPQMKRMLLKIDNIYVETKEMQNKMRAQGFDNVEFMPNFSTRDTITDSKYVSGQTYRFCIYSRIIKEKGIGLAVEAIGRINREFGKTIATLDIYGKIDYDYNDEFLSLLEQHNDYIEYKGFIKGNESVRILSEYYMLLFPTFYQGEGFPGTLVEAFMAGLPSIVSNWKYNEEIVEDGVTGIVFDLGDIDGLFKAICYSIKNYNYIINMRVNCLKEGKKYSPQNIMEPLYKLIDNELC